MSFITVSHWEAKTWNKEDETKATEKYVPMIMSMGAKSVKMCKTDELKFMVVTEWPNGELMPAMTMEFNVSDKKTISNLKRGNKVKFQVNKKLELIKIESK